MRTMGGRRGLEIKEFCDGIRADAESRAHVSHNIITTDGVWRALERPCGEWRLLPGMHAGCG